MEQFYTVKELAKLLRCSERTVHRYIDNGDIVAVCKGQGSRTLISKSAVEDYINNRTTEKESEETNELN